MAIADYDTTAANNTDAVPTQEMLKSLFEYNPANGEFTRLKRVGSCHVGEVAGTNKEGYIQIQIKGKVHKAHRLAFMYMTGSFPTDFVDHINDIKNDNRWTNLRACTKAQNEACKPLNKSNTSGFKGVSWSEERKKWSARIKHNQETIHLGRFKNIKNAALAYNEKAKKLFGEFAYINEIRN